MTSTNFGQLTELQKKMWGELVFQWQTEFSSVFSVTPRNCDSCGGPVQRHFTKCEYCGGPT